MTALKRRVIYGVFFTWSLNHASGCIKEVAALHSDHSTETLKYWDWHLCHSTVQLLVILMYLATVQVHAVMQYPVAVGDDQGGWIGGQY